MATIGYVKVESWSELMNKIDYLFTVYRSYIFRGQANSIWPLESSLSRYLNKNFKNMHEKSTATKSHFNRFKKNIRGRTKIDLENTSEDHIWSLGQHFGLYTPLLDWTHSPYVALFFSLFGPCESGIRSLWAIVENDIKEINSVKKNSQIKCML